MKNIFKSIIAVFIFSLMTLQMSAQCAHTATNIAGFPATQGVGVGFGQSFLADCINDEFTDITFSLKNFNNAVWTVELFDGQSDDPADLLYSQTGVVPTMGAANPNSGGVFYTATLGGGTGSLAYTQGQTYTFICTLESGSHAVEFGFGDQYAQGAQYYSNTSFTSVDNHFEFGSGPSSPAAMDCNISYLSTHTGGPSFRNFGQSFTGDCPDAGEFSSVTFKHKNGAAGTTTGTLYLHNGDNADAATVFYTQAFSISTGNGAPVLAEIPLGTGTGSLTYTPGQQYTWRVVLSGITTIISTSSPGYAGGSGYWENLSSPTNVNGGGGNQDFDFDVVITPTVEPVPTMGEWALITFGLIIMSMGVITVRRREEEMNLQAAS